MEAGNIYLYGHEGGEFKVDNTCEPVIKVDIKTNKDAEEQAIILDANPR